MENYSYRDLRGLKLFCFDSTQIGINEIQEFNFSIIILKNAQSFKKKKKISYFKSKY